MEEVEGIREFEPKIVAFTCNWSSYSSVDQAGISRTFYPSNVQIIRVMCTGRVDPLFVMRAFLNGADGVIIAGCHPNYCRYGGGNRQAEVRVKFLKMLMEEIGVSPARLRIEWISAMEGRRFVQVVQEMVGELKRMGPLLLRE
ncbi:MAG: hydrogenase iron-sulfur subunit [Candidatus Freyarchaeota archaeon]|nr:hydrogenase iron-sulfur subunit [Candidatus Jordarchaeia archaeon]MBS7267650.1 hydrogenase iron-sulfur subunit [Candidatus Jordarchaeia archaeon]MBS7278951.1 hydrogenase iron-sulfur subunit [Candidatus Jordarchaeia archaeon]